LKTKILFVCHGNICRSPMAEFVMKHLVEAAGVADHFEIASVTWPTLGTPATSKPPGVMCWRGVKG
jgi:protein-tyrosine phosphatase